MAVLNLWSCIVSNIFQDVCLKRKTRKQIYCLRSNFLNILFETIQNQDAILYELDKDLTSYWLMLSCSGRAIEKE